MRQKRDAPVAFYLTSLEGVFRLWLTKKEMRFYNLESGCGAYVF